jgi:hypothetical protein
MTDEPDIEAIARGRSPMDNEKLIEAVARAIDEVHEVEIGTYLLSNPIECAQAALRAHAEWMRENGMVMVPVEPSEAMIKAGEKADDECLTTVSPYYTATHIYQAMIAAAQGEG